MSIIQNDVELLRRLERAPDAPQTLRVPGELMPDGQPFDVDMRGSGEFTGEVRAKLLQTIRDQYNARESEQNAERPSQTNTSSAGDGEANSNTGDGGAGNQTSTAVTQGHEESLEGILLQRKERYLEELERLRREHSVVSRELAAKESLIAETDAALKCIQSLHNDSQET